MLRKAAAKHLPAHKNGFHYRGHEIQRIETFSDGVFAFAVTLLIVSLEVPKTFDALMITVRGFFAFGISFTFLALIWFEQHTFFRRYGLDDTQTATLNCMLLFIVLFYVYPLKFLFTLIFSNQIYRGNSPFVMNPDQMPTLMMIYSTGFIIIYLLFLLMYIHALGKKIELKLTILEQFDTRTKMYMHLIFICFGIVSIILALVLPLKQIGLAGIIYILIGPASTVYFTIRARIRKLLEAEHVQTGHAEG